MTILVGLLCQDGVVIGSDSSATFTAGQFSTIEQKVKKVEVIGDDVIVAGTGQIGMGQRFVAVATAQRAAGQFPKKDAITISKSVSAATTDDFASTKAPQGQFGALMAFVSKDGFSLCEFATRDFQPELKTKNLWYVSMGSGQPITDPFLGLMRRVFWKDSLPRVQEGVFAVTWALQHTIELNPGGINGPIQMAVLQKGKTGATKARILDDSELSEHTESVKGAEKHLGDYSELLRNSASAKSIPVMSDAADASHSSTSNQPT
jgi:20S proteasome alpha/beta subunit